jgi:hypothetical protein
MAHKQIIALSMGGLAVLGTVASLGMAPVNAAVQQQGTTTVNVVISGYCQLGGGAANVNINLTSAGSASGTPTDAWTVVCNQAGTVKWGAGTTSGAGSAAVFSGAAGNNLTTAGLAATGGFAGATGTLTGNVWGATIAGASGVTAYASGASFYAPGTALTTVGTFSAGVTSGTLTATYGASYDGTLAAGTYTGTVVYSLETN